MQKDTKLLFGNDQAQFFNNAKAWSDYVNNNINDLADIDANNNSACFYAASSIITTENIAVATSNRSASYIHRSATEATGVHFTIPISGTKTFKSDMKSYPAISGKHMFVTNADIPTSLISSDGTDLIFFLNKVSLEKTISANFPETYTTDRNINVIAPTLIDGSKLTHNYIEAFITIASIFDDLKCDGHEIERLGIDDLIQRTFLSLISDYRKSSDDINDLRLVMPNETILDIVCDAVRNYSNKVMTITEMQELTGLSTRALHAAFRNRFDCTPREWQRNEHLNRAREMLLSNSSNMSVSEVAHHQGFLSEKTFSRFYLARFGELPSETIRRKK